MMKHPLLFLFRAQREIFPFSHLYSPVIPSEARDLALAKHLTSGKARKPLFRKAPYFRHIENLRICEKSLVL